MSGSVSDPNNGVPWQSICDQAAAPMAVLDVYGRFLYLNDATCTLLGFTRDDLLCVDPEELVHADDPTSVADMIDDMFASESGRIARELRLVRSDGQVIWILLSGSLVHDTAGRPLCVVMHAQDITTRHESELRWQRTFAHAPIGMAIHDRNGQWTEVNTALCELLGRSRDELLSMRYTDLTYPGDAAHAAFADVTEGRKDTASVESRCRHEEGFPIWLLIRVSAVPDADARPAYLVSQYEELGDRRMADDHLAHLALHDPLTGLANRALLTHRLDQMLADLLPAGGVLAVLLVDLDGLKHVNDHHGHAVGDRLLLSAADVLLHTVRSWDTVARLGGDEFVLVSHVADTAGAEALRDRIQERLETEIVNGPPQLTLRASIGLATTNDPETSRSHLLHCADQEMYTRKNGKRPPQQSHLTD